MDLTLNAFNAFFEGQRFFESVTPEIRIEYPDGETEYDIDYIGEAEKKVRDYNDEAFELLNSDYVRDFENESITYFIYYISSKNEWFKGWDF